MRKLMMTLVMGLALTALGYAPAQGVEAVTTLDLEVGWNNVGVSLAPLGGGQARDFYDAMLDQGLSVPFFAIYDGVDWRVSTPGGGNFNATLDAQSAIWVYAETGGTFTFAGELGLSQARAIHLSPDAPAVDIGINGSVVAASGLAFGDSTPLFQATEDLYDVGVFVSGSPALSTEVFTVADFPLNDGEATTFVAYDALANITPLALAEDFSPTTPGNIRVRAIHTASGVGQVDILNDDTAGLLFENVDFGAASGFAELPADAYNIGIDVDDDGASDLVYPIPALPAGTVVNLFAVADNLSQVFLLAQFRNGDTARIDAIGALGRSNLRVAHLSPDAPAVDLALTDTVSGNETRPLAGAMFPMTTGFVEILEGTYDLDVVPSGDDVAASVLPVDGFTFNPGASYTVVAFGEVASIDGRVLQDDFSPTTPGNARLRAAHLAAAVGQVDIWNITDPANPAPLYQDVDFGTVGGYLEAPAGPLSIGIDVDDDASPDVVFDITLVDGETYNFFVVNDDAGNVFGVAQASMGTGVRVDPTPSATARARVLHLSPDAPNVTVLANGMVSAFTDLGYPNGTMFGELAAGTYDLGIAAAADTNVVVTTVAGYPLDADTDYTFVAYDELANLQVLDLVDDFENVDPANFRFRAIHTAIGVGQVDIWNFTDPANPTPLYTDVDFGGVGQYYDVPSAAVTIAFDTNDDAVPEALFDLPQLPAGSVFNVFAVADPTNGLYLLAQDEVGATTMIMPRPATARTRVLHLSPDAPPVTVLVDGMPSAFAGLAYPDGTDYEPIAPGTYDIGIAAAADINTVVTTVSGVTLNPGADHTIVAFNEVASLRVLNLEDDTENIASGNYRLRAIHTAAGVGQVDIWDVTDLSNPVPLYQDVNFGDAGQYYDVPSQPLSIGFDVDNDTVPDAIFDIPALPAGSAINVFAVADSTNGFYLLAQDEMSNTIAFTPTGAVNDPQVRGVHLSPDAGPVDVALNGNLAITNLAFGTPDLYQPVPEGTYDIDVTLAGTPDIVLQATGDLRNDTSYTFVAFNEAASLESLLLEDDRSPVAAGEIRLRVIHTATAAGQVDVWEVSDPNNPVILEEDLDFGNAGTELNLPAQAYTVGVDIDDDQVPDFVFDIPALAEGTIANVFAMTNNQDPLFLVAQFEDSSQAIINVTTP